MQYKIFILIFIALLLFLPIPYYSKVCSCPEDLRATLADCGCSNMLRFFYGAHYLLKTYMYPLKYIDLLSYFGYYNMPLYYVPIWFVINFILALVIIYVYSKVKNQKLK